MNKRIDLNKYFDFGKISFYGSRKINQVNVDARLYYQEALDYYSFAASGKVWNFPHTDIVMGGQCLDEINKYRGQLKNISTWDKIYYFWKNYHLNDMKSGTPDQMKAIEEWEAAGHEYDYLEVCKYLDSIGLYEVKFTGKTSKGFIDNDFVKYGHCWFVQEIPEEDLKQLFELLGKKDG